LQTIESSAREFLGKENSTTLSATVVRTIYTLEINKVGIKILITDEKL
jgi:hypothetical protein